MTTIIARNHTEFSITDLQTPFLAVGKLLFEDSTLQEYIKTFYIGDINDTLYLSAPSITILDQSIDILRGMNDTFQTELTVRLIIAIPDTDIKMLETVDSVIVQGNQMLLSRLCTYILLKILNEPILDSDGRRILDSVKDIKMIKEGLNTLGVSRRQIDVTFDQLRIDSNFLFTGS